jgi:P4 family phage/plasmid primase-like protien
MVHPYFNVLKTENASPAVVANAANIKPTSWANPKADLIEIDAQCLDHAVEIFDSCLWDGKIRGNVYEAKNAVNFSAYCRRYNFSLKTAVWGPKSFARKGNLSSGQGMISFLSFMCDVPIIEVAWELEEWLDEHVPQYKARPLSDQTELFGLELLAQNPDLDIAVLLCSNEQAAYAARYLLPGYLCLAVREGASIDKLDFAPLKDRSVFIWPDHGEAGQTWSKSVAAALFKVDMNATVYKLKPLMYLHEWAEGSSRELKVRTAQLPDGYNASDALIERWTSGMFCEVFLKLIQPVKFVRHGPPAITHTGDKLTNKQHVDNIVATFNGHIRYVNCEPSAYKKGHWPILDERVDVTQQIAHYLGDQVSKSKVNELLTLTQIFQAQTEQAVAADLNLICFQNGTLNTRTGRLIDHSPRHNLRSQIGCDWYPAAESPRFLQFLDEIFINDQDKAVKIQLLQEWAGYCMVPDNSQHKFLWLVGSGSNGKSVLLDVLRLLIGSRFVSDAHIERLGDKNVRAELEGKLVNISAEMGAEATIADGYLKSIVSGDFIEAERKYKPSFSFCPFVRMIGSTNNLPRLLDLTDGFFRRAMILKFNRQFSDAERDPALLEKLRVELPGILVWAVQGLNNLRKRGWFEMPSSSVEALNQYRKDSDPERMYFDSCLILDATGAGMSPSEIYAGYVEYCKLCGFRAKSIVNFGKRLSDFGIESSRGHSGKRWMVKMNLENEAVWGKTDTYWATKHPTQVNATDNKMTGGMKF